MRGALRRMGNLTGLKAPPRAAGVETGVTFDPIVENGRIFASPVREAPRAGWAAAAEEIAAAPEIEDEAPWRGFGIEGDDGLTW